MNTLIWTVAFGEPYHLELACEWAKSIREHGYTGDLIILSDRYFDSEYVIVRVCDFMESDKFWKAAIRKVVNLSKYDKVLFMDSDIVCLQNPERFFEMDGISIPLEPITIRKSGLNPVFLTPAELQKYGDEPAFNSGTIVMPGKDAEAFLTAWENEWAKTDWKALKDYWPKTVFYKGQMYDQGVMQAMIIRGLFPIAPIAMPVDFVGFPCLTGADASESVALHFCGLKHTGDNKRLLLDSMIECRKAGGVKAVCQKLRVMAHPIEALNDLVNKLSKAIFAYIPYSEARFKALEDEIRELKKESEHV